MQLKLKNWLSAFNWGERIKFIPQTSLNSAIAELDSNDIAFRIATADKLEQVLPEIITELQEQLNSLLTAQSNASLALLFTNNESQHIERWFSNDAIESVLPQLVQRLRVNKETNRQPFTLYINGESIHVLPSMLSQDQAESIWLFYLFNQSTPSDKQLKWHTSTLENTLEKGLKAWANKQAELKKAIEQERTIYAAELHDSLAQILAYLKLRSSKLDSLCQTPELAKLKPLTEDISTYTQSAYHQTRELIVSSRLSLQTENLSEAVSNSIREFEHQSAIVFELDNRIQSTVLNATESMQVLYIIRESLSNIVRHSHASYAHVLMKMKPDDTFCVSIRDDGTGIDPDAARNDSFGLKIMQERADRIGADLSIKNLAIRGTEISLRLETGNKP